jgi:hypothetical protein
MEARVGIEPTHKGFADLSLTTWVPRLLRAWCALSRPLLRDMASTQHARAMGKSYRRREEFWSGRPGSNRRHLPWQGSTLPLSYSRSSGFEYSVRLVWGQRSQPTGGLSATRLALETGDAIARVSQAPAPSLSAGSRTLSSALSAMRWASGVAPPARGGAFMSAR